MDTQQITITRTEMISIRKGTVTVTGSVANGRLTNGELAIDANIFGGNRLFIKNLNQLKDVVSAAQELQKAVTERLASAEIPEDENHTA